MKEKMMGFCVGIAVLAALAGCGAAPGAQTGGAAASAPGAASVPAAASSQAAGSAESVPEASSQTPSSSVSSKSGTASSASVHLSSAEYKKGGTVVRAEYPQLDGKAYDGVNAALAGEARSTIENVKKNPEDGITADTRGSIQFCSQNFVSAVFETDFMAEGAAHPSKSLRTVNYDLKKGKAVAFGGLLVDNEALCKAADAAVKQQLSKELQEYFTPQVLKDSLTQAEVYFTEDRTVVSFTVLYALGDHVEVSIPYGETKGFRTDSVVWSYLPKS